MALMLLDDLVRPGRCREFRTDEGDVRQVIEDDVEHAVLSEHAACFQPRIQPPAEEVGDLHLLEQFKLHFRCLRGSHGRPS